MSSSRTTDFAEIALRDAMAHLERSARPWSIHPHDLAQLKEDFRQDFEHEIVDLPKYLYWEYKIERLFTLVGDVAVFLAEAHRKDIGHPPHHVERADLVAACVLVRAFVCPVEPDPPGNRGDASRSEYETEAKVCRLVPFFQGVSFVNVARDIKAVIGTFPRN